MVATEMAQDIVRLNVGGSLYTTTKATLTRHPNSMLGAMFNGSIPSWTDENNCYFIDRDGSMFGHILNFLRSSQLAVPDDFKHLDQLAVEADYFQVESLIHAINDLRQKKSALSHRTGSLIEIIEVRTGSIATMPTNNSRVKTIVSGRRDMISKIPAHFFGLVEKLQNSTNNELDFTEYELQGSNARLKLAECLQSQGWQLLDSNMSSSSGYDTKSMISSLIIEQSYRDRWILPDS